MHHHTRRAVVHFNLEPELHASVGSGIVGIRPLGIYSPSCRNSSPPVSKESCIYWAVIGDTGKQARSSTEYVIKLLRSARIDRELLGPGITVDLVAAAPRKGCEGKEPSPASMENCVRTISHKLMVV